MTRTKTNPTPTPLVTPGPWESDDTQQYYQGHVIRKNGMLICRMLDLGYPSHGDRQANARLIAEAPAMRAKLVTLIDVLEHIDSWGAVAIVIQDNLRTLHVGEMLDEARALLARIDGAEEEPVQEPPEPIAPTATNAKRNAQKKPGRS